MRTQPPWQHDGCTRVQLHRFCHITKPMPVLDQSVTMQMCESSLNDVTPFATSFTISCFAVSKEDWRSFVQTYSAFLASNFLKGSIKEVFENEYATCSTKPNHDRIPVISVCRGKLVMADRVSSVGFTPSFLSQKPTYSSSCWPQTNFFGFCMIPCEAV